MAHGRAPLRAALALLAAALVAGLLTMHLPLTGDLGAHGSPHAGHAGHADGGTLDRATGQLCHADGAGHGSPASAHAVACDLSAPPAGAATALGAAALVAVVVMALVVLPGGAAAGGWLQRRGPPRGRLLRLSLCVIRV